MPELQNFSLEVFLICGRGKFSKFNLLNDIQGKNLGKASVKIDHKEDVSTKEWNNWKWQFKNRIHTLPQLAGVLGVPVEDIEKYRRVIKTYPFSVTPYYLSLIDLTDENDPIRLQCLPDTGEIDFSLGGVDDPLEEERDMPVPGLVHRYPDRCLTMVTNVCATYCRHCNRKRMWGKPEAKPSKENLQRMIDYVSRTGKIREVIVSGGDPLTVNPETLDWFLGSLKSIPHVEVLRIGSRIPIVMPMRITPDLCAMLRGHRPLWFVTQFNHPKEITPEAAKACEMLLEAGIPVLNQSVLLRGVNDSCEAMRDLLYGLQRISVKPYYLFQCEPVKGTDHFRVSIRKGMEVMEKLWRNTSGICVPGYVVDLPGGKGKVPLQPFSMLSTVRDLT